MGIVGWLGRMWPCAWVSCRQVSPAGALICSRCKRIIFGGPSSGSWRAPVARISIGQATRGLHVGSKVLGLPIPSVAQSIKYGGVEGGQSPIGLIRRKLLDDINAQVKWPGNKSLGTSTGFGDHLPPHYYGTERIHLVLQQGGLP